MASSFCAKSNRKIKSLNSVASLDTFILEPTTGRPEVDASKESSSTTMCSDIK